jgi:NAD(P)H-dependent flavin oxidoreductase YrpB (nitropropane dioxygenase family)
VVGTMFSMTKESGFSDEIIEDVILNEKLPTIQSKTSPAKMVSTSVDNGFIDRINELKTIIVEDGDGKEITAYEAYYKERVLKCINCIGEKCPFKAKDPEALYCIAHELRRAMLGEIDALIFTGMVRDKAMKLSIFKEVNGKNRTPLTTEIYDMLAGKITI